MSHALDQMADSPRRGGPGSDTRTRLDGKHQPAQRLVEFCPLIINPFLPMMADAAPATESTDGESPHATKGAAKGAAEPHAAKGPAGCAAEAATTGPLATELSRAVVPVADCWAVEPPPERVERRAGESMLFRPPPPPAPPAGRPRAQNLNPLIRLLPGFPDFLGLDQRRFAVAGLENPVFRRGSLPFPEDGQVSDYGLAAGIPEFWFWEFPKFGFRHDAALVLP